MLHQLFKKTVGNFKDGYRLYEKPIKSKTIKFLTWNLEVEEQAILNEKYSNYESSLSLGV